MKKHKNKKHHNTAVSPSGKTKGVIEFFKQTGTLVMLAVLFVIGMYGYRCLHEKVCEVEAIDKFVRHDLLISMPKGALQVEVADTQASRELGLSYRQTMGNDEGMLFIFEQPGRYGFWMKDMNFPLDIIWINQNGVVVDVQRDLSPETYREKKTYMNTSDANYVLEINAGMAEKFGLYIGSKVKITE
jgi:hypothetical protein